MLRSRSRKFEAIKKETIRKRVFLFVLMYLIFITAYLSVNTLSKYTGVAEGTGSVQVAKWEVSATSDSNTSMNVVSGYNSEASYALKVTSTSDVACTYGIVISGIPAGVEAKLDDGTYQTPTDGTVTFSDTTNQHFDAGSSGVEKNHIITLRASITAQEVDAQNIGIDVVFVQDVLE